MASAQRAATGSVSPIGLRPARAPGGNGTPDIPRALAGRPFRFRMSQWPRAARLPLATLPLRLWRRRMDQVVAIET